MGSKVDPGQNKDGTNKMIALPMECGSWNTKIHVDPTKEELIAKKLSNNKALLLLSIVTLVPFGLIILGAWKAYAIYKKSKIMK